MYFRDKEELFHYLLKRYQDGLLQRLERRVDRDRLDLRGEEDLMDIFRILIYISATAMTQAIFEEDSGPARARLCAQLDILRRGTAAPSATKT